MPWWWPFGHKEELREIAPIEIRHIQLASQFFFMPKKHQLQVLYYLGVSFKEQLIIHATMKPFRDVKDDMETHGSPEHTLTAEIFMDKLKALELMGKSVAVIGVLQNIFPSLVEATSYLPMVKKWPGVLKSQDIPVPERRL